MWVLGYMIYTTTMFPYNPDPPYFAMESRPLSPFFPFSPDQLNQDSTLHDLVFPQLGAEAQSSLTPPTAPPIKEARSPHKKAKVAIGRKRTTRKDRHSKIVTAQGPRDRRMRLNLEVASQFFNIQDMLGYDKASKTVNWLMKEAKDSIQKLKAIARPKEHSLSNEASTSELESEDISAVSDCKGNPPASPQENTAPTAKKAGRQPSKRASCLSSIGKESRAMARARARERTRVKKLGDGDQDWNELLSSSVHFETIEESGSHDVKSSLDLVAEVEEQCSHSTDQSTQLNNGDISVSILEYSNSNLFPAEPWESQLQNSLWQV